MLSKWFVRRVEYDEKVRSLSLTADQLIQEKAANDDLSKALDDALAALAEKEDRIHEMEETSSREPLTQGQYDKMLASRCIHCGGVHSVSCPRVKRLRFRGDGQTPLEVEYFESWPADRVKWIENLYVEVPS